MRFKQQEASFVLKALRQMHNEGIDSQIYESARRSLRRNADGSITVREESIGGSALAIRACELLSEYQGENHD